MSSITSPGDAQRAEALRHLFNPASVAIIGASSDPGKWGYMAAEQALQDSDRRSVYLVNHKGEEILGVRCHRSYSTLPETPELAIVTIPQFVFEATIDEVLASGTRAIVAITAGFGEESAEGQAIQDRVVEKVQRAGAVMLGPNCMGLFDGHGGIRCMPWASLPSGSVGFISQSGGLIMDVTKRLLEVGMGFSRAASVGNQADLNITDLVANFAKDPGTHIIAVYCEDLVRRGPLFDAIGSAVQGGKDVVLMTPHSSPGSVRAAKAHTGSTVANIDLVRKETRAAGAWHVSSPRDLVGVVQALLSRNRTTGNRIAVISDTGGPAVLCAGLAEVNGLQVPLLSDELQATLSQMLSPRATINNPIDLVDNLTVEPAVETLELILAAVEIDAVLMNLHVFVHETPALEAEMGKRIAQLAERSGKPVIITTHAMNGPGVIAAIKGGIPVYRDTEAAASALALVCGRFGMTSGRHGE